MQDNEALVRAHAFPKPPLFYGKEYQPTQDLHTYLLLKRRWGKLCYVNPLKRHQGLIWAWDAGRITSLL